MCFVAIPATGICPRYFIRNRGLATGITAAGSSLGGVCWPIVADQLLKTDGVSFPWTIRIIGFIMIPFFLVVVSATRPPIMRQKIQIEKQDAGLDDPGSNSTQKPQEGSHVKVAEEEKPGWSALRSPVFILLCTGLFFLNLGFPLPIFYVTTYASHVELPALSFCEWL